MQSYYDILGVAQDATTKQIKAASHYGILGVAEDAAADDIKQAYRKLSMQYHPDKSTNESSEVQSANEAMMKKIIAAKETLGDAGKRKEYDRIYQTLCDEDKRSSYDSMRKILGGSANKGGWGQVVEITPAVAFQNDYHGIFLTDSWDPITLEFNHVSLVDIANTKYHGNIIAAVNAIADYLNHPLIIITTLLGLPNYWELGEPLILKNLFWKLFKNMFGIEDKKTLGRNVINGLLSPFVFLKNVVFAVLKLAQNIIKLFTRLLPAWLNTGIGLLIMRGGLKAWELTQDENKWMNRLGYLTFVPVVLLLILNLGIGISKYLGKCIASPVDNIRESWQMRLTDGYFVAFFFMAVDITITAVLYAQLFPLLLLAAPALAAQIATAIPQLAALATYLLSNLPAVGAFVGVGMTTVGTLIERGIDSIKHLWQTTCYDEDQKPDSPGSGGDLSQTGEDGLGESSNLKYLRGVSLEETNDEEKVVELSEGEKTKSRVVDFSSKNQKKYFTVIDAVNARIDSDNESLDEENTLSGSITFQKNNG